MADVRVRILTDSSSLTKVLRELDTINKTTAFKTGALDVGRGAFTRSLGIDGQSLKDLQGFRTSLDLTNNVIRQTGQVMLEVKRKVTGSDGVGRWVREFIPVADVNQAVGNAQDLIDASKRLGKAEDEYTRRRSARRRTLRGYDDAISTRSDAVGAPYQNRIQQVLAGQQAAIAAEARLQELYNKRTVTQGGGVVSRRTVAEEAEYQKLLAQRPAILSTIANAQGRVASIEAAQASAISRDPTLKHLEAKRRGYEAVANSALRSTAAEISAARGAQAQAFKTPQDVPANIKQVLGFSPQLSSVLQRAGLGAGVGEKDPLFGQALYKQGAEFSSLTRDLIRDTYRVSGAFNDAKGVQQSFIAELDRNGKVLTRFGGNLSGLGQGLRQIFRDFQKVIEWTVATTVVFGTLAATTTQLSQIVELDKNLQRFAITAELSAGEAREFLGTLSEIARTTATPLNEIVTAADDIALATRRANQSTSDWKESITELTGAVGILTNLAGIDTEKATDLLTASIRQLGIETSEVVGLLSKITAVAGGQAGAVADITQGLAVLGETGKTAGLDLDQMIGTIQVLSQATAKSPSEVATSLKNLIGSVDAKASVKALKEFGIAVRDEAGNLRPFLSIYKDISDAISTGLIPEGRVKEITKAISGGPRRAPDAAVLLNVVDQIFSRQAISANASNEALIANARILDTTSAKITQLGVVIDTVTFDKFNESIRGTLELATNFVTLLLTAFNALPAPIISAAISMGVLLLAVKSLGIAGGYLGRVWEGIRFSLRGLTTETTAATLATQQLTAAQRAAASGLVLAGVGGKGGGPVPPVGRGSRFRGIGRAGLIAGAGLLAGGAIGASQENASLSSIISTAALGGAAVTAFVPGLQGLAAVLGVVGIAVSLLGSEAEKTKTKMLENGQAALEAFGQYQSGKQSIEELIKTQKDLQNQYDYLTAFNTRTSEQEKELTEVRTDLAIATRDIASANEALNESFEALVTNLGAAGPGVATLYEQLKAGTVDVEDQAAAIKTLTEAVLRASGSRFLSPEGFNIPDLPTTTRQLSTTGSTAATGPTREGPYGSRLTAEFDLKSLATDTDKVLTLFTKSVDEFGNASYKFDASIEPTVEGFQAISSAIHTLEGRDPELAAKLLGAWTEYASQFSTAEAVKGFYELNAALIEVKASLGDVAGGFNTNEATQARQNLETFTRLYNEVGAAGLEDRQETGAFESLKKTFLDANGEISAIKPNLIEITKIFDILKGTKLYEDLRGDSYAFLQMLGLVGEATSVVTEEMKALAEEAEEAFDASIVEATTGAIQQAAAELANIEARKLGGEFKGDKGAKEYEALRSQQLAVISSSKKLATVLQDELSPAGQLFRENLAEVAAGLSEIPGLEDATTLSADELIGRILGLGVQMGLTGNQIKKLIVLVLGLKASLNSLPATKAIDIYVTTHVSATTSAARGFGGGRLNEGRDPLTGKFDPLTGQSLKQLQQARKQAEQQQKNTLAKQLQRIINQMTRGLGTAFPSGGGGGGASSAGAGLDVSTLDIPEEIADQSNSRRNALVQQAIRQARRLQRQIPGARKEAKNDVVVLLDGMQKVLKVRGVKEDLLRKSLDNLAAIEKKRLEFETKADTIRRIRVGAGDFSSIANVPLNSRTGVSLGGAQGPINVSLNVNGQILTPAQLKQFADLVAASLKRQIANG